MSEQGDRLHKLFEILFQTHPWHGIDPGKDAPGIVRAYIELVPTDTVKYELDKNSGHIHLDRPQRFSSFCPTLYGFIPQTFCGNEVARLCAQKTGAANMQGDGDPMDICVLTEKSVTHGNFLVNAIPIGGLRLIDGHEADDKIIAVLESDLAYGHFKDISECPTEVVDRLKHYFLSYKQLPDEGPRKVEIAGVYGRVEALDVVERSLTDYRNKFGNLAEKIDEIRKLLTQGNTPGLPRQHRGLR